MLGSFSKLPGANVRPARFVVLQTNNTVVESGANGSVWGISQAATRNLPWDPIDDGFAGIAADGTPINIFGPGDDQCQLVSGGAIAIGDRLRSDAAGRGVATTTAGENVGAIALSAATGADQLITVKPIRYTV